MPRKTHNGPAITKWNAEWFERVCPPEITQIAQSKLCGYVSFEDYNVPYLETHDSCKKSNDFVDTLPVGQRLAFRFSE